MLKRSSFFLQTTKFAVYAWIFDQSTPENPRKMVRKRVKIQYFWKIHSLK